MFWSSGCVHNVCTVDMTSLRRSISCPSTVTSPSLHDVTFVPSLHDVNFISVYDVTSVTNVEVQDTDFLDTFFTFCFSPLHTRVTNKSHRIFRFCSFFVHLISNYTNVTTKVHTCFLGARSYDEKERLARPPLHGTARPWEEPWSQG